MCRISKKLVMCMQMYFRHHASFSSLLMLCFSDQDSNFSIFHLALMILQTQPIPSSYYTFSFLALHNKPESYTPTLLYKIMIHRVTGIALKYHQIRKMVFDERSIPVLYCLRTTGHKYFIVMTLQYAPRYHTTSFVMIRAILEIQKNKRS